MTYLLDTCVISDFIKGEVGTQERLKFYSPQLCAISAVTVMEIEYGLRLNPAKAIKIRPIIKELLTPMMIFPFGESESLCAATIRAQLKQEGQPIGFYDLLIGATAFANGHTLVTANIKEFSRISELKSENWRL